MSRESHCHSAYWVGLNGLSGRWQCQATILAIGRISLFSLLLLPWLRLGCLSQGTSASVLCTSSTVAEFWCWLTPVTLTDSRPAVNWPQLNGSLCTARSDMIQWGWVASNTIWCQDLPINWPARPANWAKEYAILFRNWMQQEDCCLDGPMMASRHKEFITPKYWFAMKILKDKAVTAANTAYYWPGFVFNLKNRSCGQEVTMSTFVSTWLPSH